MRRLSIIDGYLTVFFSLICGILLSLILALFYGARIGEVRLKSEIAMDISMNSVLAEYSRALFDQYDLLMVDMSYGTENGNIENVETHFKNYLDKNFARTLIGRATSSSNLTGTSCSEAKIPAYSLAGDGSGSVLRRQILAYMEAEPLEKEFSEVAGQVKVLKAENLDSYDVDQEARRRKQELDDLFEENEVDEEKMDDSTIEKASSLWDQAVLDKCITNRWGLSSVEVPLREFYSHRQGHLYGTGLDDVREITLTESLLFDQYLFEKCGNYRNVLEKSRLKYQIEYLIVGKNSDQENLSKVLETILFWRAASNFFSMETDGRKKAQTLRLASLIGMVIPIEGLVPVLDACLQIYWVLAETVADLRCLTNGGGVNLIKGHNEWHLPNLIDVLFADREYKHCRKGGGLDYAGYLRLLVFQKTLFEKTDRLMDLMEMDIRETPGNKAFRMDACLDCMTGEMQVKSRIGYSTSLSRTYGYEMRDEKQK